MPVSGLGVIGAMSILVTFAQNRAGLAGCDTLEVDEDSDPGSSSPLSGLTLIPPETPRSGVGVDTYAITPKGSHSVAAL